MSLHADLLNSVKDSPQARGGRVDIASSGPRDSVMICGDREGLARLALAILDHADSKGERESTFARDLFGDASEIQEVIFLTLPEVEDPLGPPPPRPSFLLALIRLLFSRRSRRQ